MKKIILTHTCFSLMSFSEITNLLALSLRMAGVRSYA